MSEKEKIQENQYYFPYHHLTHEKDGSIYTFRHLFWGLVHYTYLSYLIEEISKENFTILTDIGCGEGRIISELEKKHPESKLIGVDISSRAIDFAKAFSVKNSTFIVHDITKNTLPEKSDLIVSSEVIEHIRPTEVAAYIENIAESLNDNGILLITTPTTNVKVNKKHYQHFTSEMFDELLRKRFTSIEYTYLNANSFFAKLLQSILSNRFYLSNCEKINRWVLKTYRKHFLISSKSAGARIVVRAVKSN